MEQYREQELLLADLAEKGRKRVREDSTYYLVETSRGKWRGCFLGMVVVGHFGQASRVKKKISGSGESGSHFMYEFIVQELHVPLELVHEVEGLHLDGVPATEIIDMLRSGELEYTP